jgi:hypothetical protein
VNFQAARLRTDHLPMCKKKPYTMAFDLAKFLEYSTHVCTLPITRKYVYEALRYSLVSSIPALLIVCSRLLFVELVRLWIDETSLRH